MESPKGFLQSQIISSMIFNQATRTHIVIIFHIFNSCPCGTDVSLQISSLSGKNFVTSYFSLSNSVKYVNFCRLTNDVTVCVLIAGNSSLSENKSSSLIHQYVPFLTQNFYANTQFMRASGFSAPAFTSFPSKWGFIFCSYPIFSILLKVLYYPAIHGLADIENRVINRQGQFLKYENSKIYYPVTKMQFCPT